VEQSHTAHQLQQFEKEAAHVQDLFTRTRSLSVGIQTSQKLFFRSTTFSISEVAHPPSGGIKIARKLKHVKRIHDCRLY
jgi:hypothetical protein